MIENNKITLSDKDNKDIVYDILLTFDADDNHFIVYTDNSLDEDGFIKTYAGIYENNGKKERLLPVESDEHWELIEDLLSKLDSDSE